MASIKLHIFSASWCGPCQALKPTIQNLRGEYPAVDIIEYDIDSTEGAYLAEIYGFPKGAVPKAVITGHGRADKLSSPDANNLRQGLNDALGLVSDIGVGLPNTAGNTTSSTIGTFVRQRWILISLLAAGLIGSFFLYKYILSKNN